MILLLGVAEIIRLPSTSSLPSGDGEMPNGIRPMKIQRPRTPLIDAVAAHDKNKLRKVTERAMPLFPKEEEKDTFLEQIRAKV
ncbi:protein SCAR2-like [Helianthus annuus]|nr:protein SCAR2-like [Helianthus annuus]